MSEIKKGSIKPSTQLANKIASHICNNYQNVRTIGAKQGNKTPYEYVSSLYWVKIKPTGVGKFRAYIRNAQNDKIYLDLDDADQQIIYTALEAATATKEAIEWKDKEKTRQEKASALLNMIDEREAGVDKND